MNEPKTKTIKQCKTCPWRVDADVNNIPNYSHELHEKLDKTIAEPGDVATALCPTMHIMACHYSKPDAEIPCAGWLHHQIGEGNNIGVRLRVMQGLLPVPEVDGEQLETFEATLCGAALRRKRKAKR